MTLVRVNPRRNVRPFFVNPHFDNLFNDFFNKNISETVGTDHILSQPTVNIIENKDDFIIEIAAPGLTKKDFEINVENNQLTISAQKEIVEDKQEVNYNRREFDFSTFKRNFQLPKTIKTDDIKAKYSSGILTVVLPKIEEAKEKPARVIKIA